MRGRLSGWAWAAVILSLGCGDPVLVQGDLPGTMRVVAGNPPDLGAEDRTPATSLGLVQPADLAMDRDGVAYLTDSGANRIVAIGSDGSVIEVAGASTCDGSRCLSGPTWIAVDPAGGLVVVEPEAGLVWRVPVPGGTLAGTVIAGGGGGEAVSGAGATTVRLDGPAGIALGPEGTMYISERGRHRVWAIERGGTLTLVAGTGEVGDRGDGAPAIGARLRAPGGLAVSGDRLYLADTGNHRVRVVELGGGVIRAFAGNGNQGHSGDGGPAQVGTMRFPEDVVVAEDGFTVFVADRGNRRLRSISLRNGRIATFAGTGDAEYGGSGLPAGETALAAPTHVAVGLDAFVFVTDRDNRLVWRSQIRF